MFVVILLPLLLSISVQMAASPVCVASARPHCLDDQRDNALHLGRSLTLSQRWPSVRSPGGLVGAFHLRDRTQLTMGRA
jgi:hypothetical protein